MSYLHRNLLVDETLLQNNKSLSIWEKFWYFLRENLDYSPSPSFSPSLSLCLSLSPSFSTSLWSFSLFFSLPLSQSLIIKFFLQNSFKGRVDLNYTSGTEADRQKHRALVIKDPLSTDSGMYACDVQTYSSNDRKTANLLVISKSHI